MVNFLLATMYCTAQMQHHYTTCQLMGVAAVLIVSHYDS